MQKRSLFLALTAGVLIWGFGALDARAESLTLSVYAGTDTTAAFLYQAIGSSTAVTANTGVLNSALSGAGFGAYSFSNLGGTSNNPGSTQVGVGAFIQTTGGMSVTAGGSGEGTPITVVLTEGGFTLPANGPSLQDVGQTTFAGLSSGSYGTEGLFTDATGATAMTPLGTLTNTGQTTVSTPLGAYVTPFSLENQTVLSGTSLSRNPLVPGAISISQTVTTTASVIPEPASLVMMLTGMPLSLVVLGLRRRRRAAA